MKGQNNNLLSSENGKFFPQNQLPSVNSNTFQGEKTNNLQNNFPYNQNSNSNHPNLFAPNINIINQSNIISSQNQNIYHESSLFNSNQFYQNNGTLLPHFSSRLPDEDLMRGRPIYTEYQRKMKEKKEINKKPYNEKASEELKKKIIQKIINPNTNPTFDEIQESILDYGYYIENKIDYEMKTTPQNFIGIQEAKEKKDTNKKLFVLGKLGESLQNMGIKVAIDKREDLKSDEYIINNQFISSGLIKRNKYEIHIQENEAVKNLILYDQKEQTFFIEKWKQRISNYVGVSKDKIYISNIRNGSITMDAIFKKDFNIDINGKNIDIDEKMKNFANSNPKIKSIFKKNILGACKLTLDMLDERGNRDPKDWAKPGEKRGGKEYFPPDENWVGFGLKVYGLYDNNNNDWIAMNGNPNEWAVAYHGTAEKSVRPICLKNGKFFSTTKEGATRQKCKDCENVNVLSKNKYPFCGEGAYCSPKLDYANIYNKGIIIMCRVNPKLIRIPKGEFEENEWITDGTRNTIRPYRILCKLNS